MKEKCVRYIQRGFIAKGTKTPKRSRTIRWYSPCPTCGKYRFHDRMTDGFICGHICNECVEIHGFERLY